MDEEFAAALRLARSDPALAAIVESAISATCPLEYDVLGAATIRDIIAGRQFESPQTGRHLELMEVVNGVASVAGLVQCSIAAVVWARKRWSAADDAAARKDRARAAAHESLKQSPTLAALIAERPSIEAEVMALVERALQDPGGG